MVRFSLHALAAGWLASSVVLFAVEASADIVLLKDGTRFEGTVKLQELGKYVIVELPNGSQKTVMWEDLKEIEVSTTSETKPPPPVAEQGRKHRKRLDKTEFSGEATKSGTTVSVVHECGEGEPGCREEATVKIEAGDVKATYDAVEDCSNGSGEACTKTTAASAGQDGLRIAITKESATRVTEPRTGAMQFGLSANFLYATGEMLEMMGFTAGINVRLLQGPQFPDETGGSWFGYFLEPSAQLSYSKTIVETPEQCFGGECFGGKQESNSGAAMLNGTVGIQWMSFGALDEETVQQSGWGVALGGQVGRYIPFEGEGATTYGAAFNILRPKYNPGTGAFVTEQLNLFLLPTSDMFFLLIGIQKSWG